MATKVAVVTGSNKGVGFAIVRALCKSFKGDVILTARNPDLGKAAVQELEKEGLHPKFHQLDISDHASIVALRDFLQNTYQGIDVLVNNAGIAYKVASTASFAEQAEVTLKTNYFATLDACEVLYPLLRPHARVSNVSSMVSQFGLAKCSDALKARFVSTDITMEELSSIMKKFVETAQNGTFKEEGFAETSYGMSKIGVTVMSMIQQREMDKKGADDIVINATEQPHPLRLCVEEHIALCDTVHEFEEDGVVIKCSREDGNYIVAVVIRSDKCIDIFLQEKLKTC
ncbi:carbonyl reductase [NADPH] 1 [Elysia marginata]|uniref:Carbonyl reductase [NADPH] 1 n=1 Tax=Elysia marginata TaxID=1093978 RepID=A0AAV4F082_9GAST|nr:carbonyl reductase [NADPH] 1 [Elysia marginata]